MSAKGTTALFVCGVGAAAIGWAADGTPEQWLYGQQEYQAKCAVCHGASGKGDGLMAWALSPRPSDLTTYAARHGGVLSETQVAEAIDGRPSTGLPSPSREMPVWGSEFRAGVTASPEPPTEPEWHVSARIAALTVYVSSLQAK